MTREQVLTYLSGQEGYLSGETVSRALGISRAAVNAAVQALRREGYEIESSTRKGYRLQSVPDCLSSGALRTCLPPERMQRVLALNSVDSTNSRLRAMAFEGAAEGQVVLAEEQTGGRGRLGRSFESPRGKGIYLSRLLRPVCAPGDAPRLTAWTAVAVSDAVETVCGVRPEIKWVNDLLLGGRKLGGILTEMAVEGESGRIEQVIIGVGLNVNHLPEDFSPALRPAATSLRMELDRPVDRARLAAALILELDEMSRAWPRDNSRYLAAYQSACRTPGKKVRVFRGEESAEALALGVNDDFSLALRYEDGREENLSSGEVRVREQT